MMPWTRQRDGSYTCRAYTLVKIANTRTPRRHDEVVWEVRHGDARLSVQPTLADAKQTAEAHEKVEP